MRVSAFFVFARWLLVLQTLLSFSYAAAAEPSLQPGDYVTERGWGRLQMTRDNAEALKFSIRAIGANGHSCGLRGEIREGRTLLETGDPGKNCVVQFTAVAEGVDVSSVDPQLCRYYCGARARFDGRYLKTVAACVPAAVKRTRDEFKRLYERKNFSAARLKLEPLLSDCVVTLEWLETGWIRNDLAVTYYRLGDVAACRRVLEPLQKDAAGRDADVRNNLPPSEADNWLPVVKAARTNLKLCVEKAPR